MVSVQWLHSAAVMGKVAPLEARSGAACPSVVEVEVRPGRAGELTGKVERVGRLLEWFTH